MESGDGNPGCGSLTMEFSWMCLPCGSLVLGFIDRDSPRELMDLLRDVGMESEAVFQTLFHAPPDIPVEEELRPGFGEGGFVVVRAVKAS